MLGDPMRNGNYVDVYANGSRAESDCWGAWGCCFEEMR